MWSWLVLVPVQGLLADRRRGPAGPPSPVERGLTQVPCSADRTIASSTAALCTASGRVAPHGVDSAIERRKRWASTTLRSS